MQPTSAWTEIKKAITYRALLVPLALTSCSFPSKSINCINESITATFADGTVQQMRSNLGSEAFTWNKEEGVIEAMVIEKGIEVPKKFPATYKDGTLSFTIKSLSDMQYSMENDGEMNMVLESSSPDGDYTMATKSKCNRID